MRKQSRPIAFARPQHRQPARRVTRRRILRIGGQMALGLPILAAAERPSTAAAGEYAQKSGALRLASVRTVEDGGLLGALVAGFEERTGAEVDVYIGEDVYGRARAGEADLVLSHFGHQGTQAFVTDGLGLWPRAVLYNQTALLAHPSDPADVRGAVDIVEAFRRIARAGAPFIVNDIDGQRYLTETLWHAAGRPERTGWYRDTGVRTAAAARAAAAAAGYTLWGLTPFLMAQQQAHVDLSPVIFNDALVQRMMVTVAVNPARLPGVNAAGGEAFQQYLLSPDTQALILDHRYPGIDHPLFWPAGRQNAADVLP